MLALLLEGGHTTIAGRLAGAFRNIGRNRIAGDIVKTMKTADYDIREEDPFEDTINLILPALEQPPYVNRIPQPISGRPWPAFRYRLLSQGSRRHLCYRRLSLVVH